MLNKVRNFLGGKKVTSAEVTVKEMEYQIKQWKASAKRTEMIIASKYYLGEHDILSRTRTAIGATGSPTNVTNLPNNKIVDNMYAKMVDQKKNYLLGKPFLITSKNEEVSEKLKSVTTKSFHKLMKNVAESSINYGISWLYAYYDEFSVLKFQKFDGIEILPIWKDKEHTTLSYAIRVYETEKFVNGKTETVENVEVYTEQGVSYYILKSEKLVVDTEKGVSKSYATLSFAGDNSKNKASSENGKNKVNTEVGKEDKSSNKKDKKLDEEENLDFNFMNIPLIAFKSNAKEQPLISRVKQLQDALNSVMSDFVNNMQEDSRNTILVLKNYDGENLGEFRKNLATYGAVKVRTIDGADGGIETLQVEVNAENYKSIIKLLKTSLIENARGYDGKDERLSGNPNQLNIQSMYTDIDLDTNEMETEFQSSLEEVMWFVKMDYANEALTEIDSEPIEIVFNRSVLINDSQTIDNINKSKELLSNRTLLANHPYVLDLEKELIFIENEKKDVTIESEIDNKEVIDKTKNNVETDKDDTFKKENEKLKNVENVTNSKQLKK